MEDLPVRKRSARSGVTLPEVLVALGIAGLVSFGAWSGFSMIGRQSEQVQQHSTVMQAASSLLANLELDSAALYLAEENALSVVVEQDGKVLRFFRTSGTQDPEFIKTEDVQIVSVQYEIIPHSSLGFVMTRKTSGNLGTTSKQWDTYPIQNARFALEHLNESTFLSLEMLFQDPEALEPGSKKSASLPLRWLHLVSTYPGLGERNPVPPYFREVIPPRTETGPTHTITLPER